MMIMVISAEITGRIRLADLRHEDEVVSEINNSCWIQQELLFLIPHTRGSAQCSQHSRCDRYDDLRNELNSFFLSHNKLLSYLYGS